jgi:hypothetical protein
MTRDELHAAIMGLKNSTPVDHCRVTNECIAYQKGHRDARHAAAELVAKLDGDPSPPQGFPDGEPASVIFAYMRRCARSWVPDARLMGNLRAGDIVRALDTLDGERWIPVGERMPVMDQTKLVWIGYTARAWLNGNVWQSDEWHADIPVASGRVTHWKDEEGPKP